MASTEDRPWANIPLDVAGLVLKRLPAHVDRVRFAAVCPQWRSAAHQVKLPPAMPLLALKAGDIFYSMPSGEPLHFAGYKNIHHGGCCNGFNPACVDGSLNDFDTACGHWLVYGRSRDLLLVDPFSGSTMTLPPPHSFVDTGISHKLYTDLKYSQVIKLMVCSPNLIAALLKCKESNRIAVCRPGGSMWSVARDISLWITDMAFYQGELYVLDYHEDLLALDISVDDKTGDPWVSRIGRVINKNQFDNDLTLRMLYLVESCGSLMLVHRRTFHKHVQCEAQILTFSGQCEPDVSTFKADFGGSQWCRVTTLADDEALFLGPCSRAVGMPQGDSPGNHMWFLDDYKDFHMWDAYTSLRSGTSSVAYRKPFSPLPMISWSGHLGNAGAAWLFPPN